MDQNFEKPQRVQQKWWSRVRNGSKLFRGCLRRESEESQLPFLMLALI